MISAHTPVLLILNSEQMISGSCNREDAKITGITPAEFTYSGMFVV